MKAEPVKVKCPTCGRMAETLFTWHKLYDSCAACNPHITGGSLAAHLRELERRRKDGAR